MAGNYDYPRAGTPSRPPLPPAPPDRRSEATAGLRHLRELLDSDRQRDRQRLAIEALDSELLHMSAEPISSRLERRRRGLQEQIGVQPSELSRHSPEPTPPPQRNGVMRLRRRPVRPSERRPRYRESTDSPGPSELETIRSRSRLVDPMSTLSPLGERPPRVGSPDLLSQEYSGEAQVNFQNRWRAKRRKLDSDDTRDIFQGFAYGHYGQVVPGPLKMEIVSCDGGQYSEPNGDSSWPEHVLTDDASVYCTKSDRCNMILRHQGETPFCLKKLVIKAPKSGFDAAVQEGMIFVSMERDDLLTRTSQYQMQYSPHRKHRHAEQAQIRLQPSHEYFNSVRSPLRSLDESTHRRRPWQEQTTPTEDYDGLHCSVPRVPEFRVTTDYDDNSEDGSGHHGSEGEDVTTAAEVELERLQSLQDHYLSRYEELAQRFGPGAVDTEDDSSDDGWDENLIASDSHERFGSSRGIGAGSNRFRAERASGSTAIDRFRTWNRHRLTPSRTHVSTTLQNPSGRNNGTNGHVQPEPLIPHASFFIRRDKDMVAIKFDPPVSGKFILVKLWAPCPNANIDIQSIIAHGYAGPRFFPAVSVR